MAMRIAETFTNQLNSIVWIFQFSGLQYFFINLKKLPHKSCVKLPKALSLIIFLLFMVFVNISFYYFNERQFESVRKVDKITFVLEQLSNISYFVTSYVAITTSYLTRHTEEKLYNTVYTIFVKMEQHFQHNVNFEGFFQQIRKKIRILLSIEVGSIVVLNILIYFGAINEDGYNWACMGVAMTMFKLISLKHIFQVDLVRFLLKELSGQLEKFQEQENYTIKMVDSFELRRESNSSIDFISGAKEIYGMIWECSQLINQTLGWSILSLIVSIVFAIILMTFFEFDLLMGSNGSKFILNSGELFIFEYLILFFYFIILLQVWE